MKIGVVIITYNPDIELFTRVIDSLIEKFQKVCVVDNGSSNYNELRMVLTSPKIELISLPVNEGIAKATNVGFHYFQESDYDFVMTSDQDSLYPIDYYDNIVTNCNYFSSELETIAAFCPIFYDENTKQDGQIVKKSKFYMKKTSLTNEFEDVFETIASGLVINMKNLNEIGFMDESLFIDWVDFEWCWRAYYKEKRIICCKNLRISHRLGDGTKKILNRNISIHSYIRNYYITRNAFYLSTHTMYLSKSAKLIIFFKSFQYIIIFPLISNDSFKNLCFTLRGFVDGLKGKMGKITLK